MIKKERHYKKTPDGIIEVRRNWQHKCIEKCTTIKKARKSILLCKKLIKANEELIEAYQIGEQSKKIKNNNMPIKEKK